MPKHLHIWQVLPRPPSLVPRTEHKYEHRAGRKLDHHPRPGPTIDPESIGIAPFFSEEAYEQNGSFTNLFGQNIDTTASYYLGGPKHEVSYAFPRLNPSIELAQVSDPGGGYSVTGGSVDGTVGGSTLSAAVVPASGIYGF